MPLLLVPASVHYDSDSYDDYENTNEDADDGDTALPHGIGWQVCPVRRNGGGRRVVSWKEDTSLDVDITTRQLKNIYAIIKIYIYLEAQFISRPMRKQYFCHLLPKTGTLLGLLFAISYQLLKNG